MSSRKRKPAPPPVEREPAPRSRRPATRTAAALLLLALALRLPFLGGADLWCDEVLFVQMSSPPMTPAQVVRNQWERFAVVIHLPLPEVAQNVFLWCFGGRTVEGNVVRPALQRVPAVLWGALTVPLFFALGRRLLSARAALLAGLMMAALFYPVYYAREAYYYAPTLFFATALLHAVARVLEGDARRRDSLYVLLAGAGVTGSHFSGTGFVLVLLGSVLAGAGLARERGSRPAWSAARRVALALAGALVLVSPFHARLLAQRRMMPEFLTGPTFVQMVNDMLGKVFLGTWPPAAALAWILAVCGLAGFWMARPRRPFFRMAVILSLAGTAVTLLACGRSLYHPRYFATLVPVYYLLFAAGLEWAIVRLLPRNAGKISAVFAVAGGLLLLPHMALYLPALYTLPAKAVDYAGIARWLNANLRPGAPYFFDCGGWDLRFVPGTFPTPGLTPAVWIAWNGPDFEETKREASRRVMRQFPESAYIESLRSPWDEPRRFYRRVFELRNPPLQRLARMGVFHKVEPPGADPLDRNIRYNTREDAVAIAKEQGRDVYVEFRDFRAAQIAQETYARVRPGAAAEIGIVNLRDAPLRGALVLTGAVAGPAADYAFDLYLDGRSLQRERRPARAMWTLESPEIELPAGTHVLRWTVQPALGGPAESLIVSDLSFRRAGAAPPG